MNAGPSLDKARRQAQANANQFGVAYRLFSWGGNYWVERADLANRPEGDELFQPEPRAESPQQRSNEP